MGIMERCKDHHDLDREARQAASADPSKWIAAVYVAGWATATLTNGFPVGWILFRKETESGGSDFNYGPSRTSPENEAKMIAAAIGIERELCGHMLSLESTLEGAACDISIACRSLGPVNADAFQDAMEAGQEIAKSHCKSIHAIAIALLANGDQLRAQELHSLFTWGVNLA